MLTMHLEIIACNRMLSVLTCRICTSGLFVRCTVFCIGIGVAFAIQIGRSDFEVSNANSNETLLIRMERCSI